MIVYNILFAPPNFHTTIWYDMGILYLITGTINIDIGLFYIPYDANVYLVIEAFRKKIL